MLSVVKNTQLRTWFKRDHFYSGEMSLNRSERHTPDKFEECQQIWQSGNVIWTSGKRYQKNKPMKTVLYHTICVRTVIQLEYLIIYVLLHPPNMLHFAFMCVCLSIHSNVASESCRRTFIEIFTCTHLLINGYTSHRSSWLRTGPDSSGEASTLVYP